jgi:hypothetical protein
MFKRGDRVEHRSRGKGTFVQYEFEGLTLEQHAAYIEFDKDSNANGDTLCVTIAMLDKIE